MEIPPDETILEWLQSADPPQRDRGLEVLYVANYPPVERFVLKNSGNAQDAQDLFQEAILVFYNQVLDGRLQLASSIKTYVFAISRNMWLSKLRKLRKGNNAELPVPDEEEPASEQRIIETEEDELIAEVFQLLADGCKEVLLLYYYQQLPLREITRIMGYKSEQVAKNKKSMCMKELRKLVFKDAYLESILRKN